MKLYQENWDDITISEYQHIIKIHDKYTSVFPRALEVLCYLTDSDEWEQLEPHYIIEEYYYNIWLEHPPILNNVADEINEYRLKPFDKLNLGEWIDLDNAIINDEYSKILAILYRKWKVNEWGVIEYEPYEFTLTERIKIFDDCSTAEVIGVINNSYQYREDLLRVFSGLFESYEDEELTDEEQEMLSESEIREIEEGIRNDNNKRDFAWPRLLDDMSSGNWANIPGVLELPHTFVFNMRMAKKVYES